MTTRFLKILLVDDDTQILKALARQLKGHELYFANDPSIALDELYKENIDLLISDYSMPGGDGVTLLKRVQRLFPKVRRVLMSGYLSSNFSELISNGVVEHFLPKPFFSDMVQSIVNWGSTKGDAKNREPYSEQNRRITGAANHDLT